MNTPDSQPGAPARPLRILCAEDNATNRIVIGAILEGLGHTVFFAENGQEAVDFLSTERVDAVLMDNRMPVMDGFTAARIIRDEHSSVLDHAVPIIALTANASNGYREECLAAGMNDFLTKPIREHTVSAALANATRSSQPSPEIDRDERSRPSITPAPDAPEGMSEEELLALLDDAESQPSADPSASLSPGAQRQISQQFLNDTPKLLNLARIAFGLRDWETLGRAGHSLKSSARYVRANKLSELGRELEEVAGQGDSPRLPSLLKECDCEFTLVVERLTSAPV